MYKIRAEEFKLNVRKSENYKKDYIDTLCL